MHQFLWSLLLGDRNRNLDMLVNAPVPAEPLSAKIWHLTKVGYNREQLLQGLALLANCPWSSTGVEQQHGSASTIRKLHTAYGKDTLCSRALVHSARALFSEAQSSLAVSKREELVKRLQAKKPRIFGPRQLYMKQLSDLAKEWKSKGKSVPADINKKIMQRHAQRFKDLPPEKVAQLSAAAAAERDKRELLWADKLEEAKSVLPLETQTSARNN